RARIPAGPPSLRTIFKPKLGNVNVYERTSIASGPIIIVQEDDQYTSPQPFVVHHSRVADVILTQGIETYGLVRRKDTLFQVRMEALPGATTNLPRLDGARLTAFPTTGESYDLEGSTPNTVLPNGPALTSMGQALNFFIPGSHADAERFRYRASITHGGIEVARVESQAESARFHDVPSPRILFV